MRRKKQIAALLLALLLIAQSTACAHKSGTYRTIETLETGSLALGFRTDDLCASYVEAAIRELAGAIYHFHAKDTKVDEINVARNGVLDTQNMGNFLERSWVFRTVGYGIGTQAWKDILSTLRKVGYEGAVSIEHEDGLMSVREGLEKAIACLKDTMMFEDPAQMWWA